MGNQLSHSASSKFQDCPKAFDFHYNHRLRPKTQSAALLFGSAVDAAVTSLMADPTISPEEVFRTSWAKQEINGILTDLPFCTQIAYANSDFDDDLLDNKDLESLALTYTIPKESVKESISNLYAKKERTGFAGLSESEKAFLNYANWLSLSKKGLLMIKAVREEILPNITEVLATQAYVSLENDEGDKVIGYADLVARYKGFEKPIIFDFKTSSREYEQDSVLTSSQLTLYVHSLSDKYDNTRLAGYFVLSKRVIKNKTKECSKCKKDGTGQRHKKCDAEISGSRCNGEWIETIDPKIFVQTIISEIPDQTELIVIENLDMINQAIKSGNFSRNLGACVKPWGKCQFFDKCYKGSDQGLIQVAARERRR